MSVNFKSYYIISYHITTSLPPPSLPDHYSCGNTDTYATLKSPDKPTNDSRKASQVEGDLISPPLIIDLRLVAAPRPSTTALVHEILRVLIARWRPRLLGLSLRFSAFPLCLIEQRVSPLFLRAAILGQPVPIVHLNSLLYSPKSVAKCWIILLEIRSHVVRNIRYYPSRTRPPWYLVDVTLRERIQRLLPTPSKRRK